VSLHGRTAVVFSALSRRAAALVVALAVLGSMSAHAAPSLPEIRLSGRNGVPACVTPDRLMAFLKQRNRKLDPRFRNIAAYYKQHGEAWGVRWDYAFFQMAIETNFLSYRQPNGRMGDVDPKQNNFAGIGTTGGGVPGDSFPDVSTGVLGQIQHLVVYSGEMIPEPVAPRTRLKQEHILAKSHELKRPVRFSDLAGRWAADRKYARSIEWVAERFRTEQCKGRAMQVADVLPWHGANGAAVPKAAEGAAPVKAVSSWEQHAPGAKPEKTSKKAEKAKSKAKAPHAPVAAVAPARETVVLGPVVAAPPAPVARGDEGSNFALFSPPAGLAEAAIPAPEQPVGATQNPAAVSGKTVGGFMVGSVAKPDYPPPSGLGVKPGRCVIETARYGGETTVLVKAPSGDATHYVALSVLDGFEDSMTKSFLASRPEGGDVLGTFPSRDAALAKARTLCAD
jgi:hypothetical protein